MKRKSFLISVIAAALLLTACGSSHGGAYKNAEATMDYAASAAEGVYEDYAYDYEEAMPMAEEAPAPEQAEEVKDNDRKLIKTYSLEVETREYGKLIGQIETKVAVLGGYIENCDTGILSYSKETHYARYVIRIPKDNADKFVENVEEASNVVEKSTNVEDVTLQYVDMESRKNALKTEQARLLELLEKAETVEDLITVEARLSEVRYQIESMESQLRTYDNKIDYSTIHLNVNEVEEITKPEEKTFGGRIKDGLIENFGDAIEMIGDFIVWLITGLPYWILLIVFAAVVYLIVKLCIKGAKKRKQKKWEKKQKMMQMQQAAQMQRQQQAAQAQNTQQMQNPQTAAPAQQAAPVQENADNENKSNED